MNILVRLPNWLGDAVMATYALELLFKAYPNANFYLLGSKVSSELFLQKNVICIEDCSKRATFRILSLFKLARSIPKSDIAITFQNSFLSALFLCFNGAKFRVGFNKEMRAFLLNIAPKRPKKMHEAMRYAFLVESLLKAQNVAIPAIKKSLYLQAPKIKLPFIKDSKILGINAGAAFGSAKRWEEAYFAEVILHFLEKNYFIILFGVAQENAINEAIFNAIPTNLQERILNLSGKTTLAELMAYFLQLDLLLTNDSGPMHIAAALNVKTIALFGPTKDDETAPFCAKFAKIISLKNIGFQLPCAPCMKRSCPKSPKSSDYHACMRDLKPKFVISALENLEGEK